MLDYVERYALQTLDFHHTIRIEQVLIRSKIGPPDVVLCAL